MQPLDDVDDAAQVTRTTYATRRRRLLAAGGSVEFDVELRTAEEPAAVEAGFAADLAGGMGALAAALQHDPVAQAAR